MTIDQTVGHSLSQSAEVDKSHGERMLFDCFVEEHQFANHSGRHELYTAKIEDNTLRGSRGPFAEIAQIVDVEYLNVIRN